MDQFNRIAQKLAEASISGETALSEDYEGYRQSAVQAMRYYVDAMFPNYCERPERPGYREDIRVHYLKAAHHNLVETLRHIVSDEEAENAADRMDEKLPEIYDLLRTDIRAGFEGDPAAKSIDEIILTYPAFVAISAHRVAHEIYLMGYTLVARMMSEYAHRKTGIDIHPGATIGHSFFIDHGTGVVIGETTVIGDHVKLYQHVTLGAKSFQVAEDGTLVKGIKRHPNIGNDVVIYAGATILGGDVTIGDGSVIGGNVWLTKSVEPGSKVYQK